MILKKNQERPDARRSGEQDCADFKFGLNPLFGCSAAPRLRGIPRRGQPCRG